MAYTDPWTIAEVPGTELASNIDNRFRSIALAIEERMETELIVDWRADPVAVKDAIKGLRAGKFLFIGGSAFRELNGSLKFVELNPNFLAVFRGSARIIAPLVLPPGVTVKQIEWLVNRGDVSSYTWRFISVDFTNPPSESVLATGNDNVAGTHVHVSAAMNHTIALNALYYLDLDTAGSNDNNSMFLYGVRVTYDTPSSLQTY